MDLVFNLNWIKLYMIHLRRRRHQIHVQHIFLKSLNDAYEPLYEGCNTATTLSATTQLLNCKSKFNTSEACYDRILSIVKGLLSKDDKLPNNYYATKCIVKQLGSRYEKIHVCNNNCILYFAENKDLDKCPICEHPRYVVDKMKGRSKGIPYKVLRYLPFP